MNTLALIRGAKTWILKTISQYRSEKSAAILKKFPRGKNRKINRQCTVVVVHWLIWFYGSGLWALALAIGRRPPH